MFHLKFLHSSHESLSSSCNLTNLKTNIPSSLPQFSPVCQEWFQGTTAEPHRSWLPVKVEATDRQQKSQPRSSFIVGFRKCFSTYMWVWVCLMFWEFTSNKGMKPRCEDLTQWELGSHPVSPSCLLSCLLCGHSCAVQLGRHIFSDRSKHSPKGSHLPWTCPCRRSCVWCCVLLKILSDGIRIKGVQLSNKPVTEQSNW